MAPSARADKNVIVTSTATPAYTEQKFAGAKPKLETYVFMQGNYFEGDTADGSIDKMPFRRIAEFLAPELAKQHYLPITDPKKADLVLVVHWGTTVRHINIQEMSAHDTIRSDTSESGGTLNKEAQTAATTGTLDASGAMLAEWADDSKRQNDFDALEQFNDQIGSEMVRTSNVVLLGYGRFLTRYKDQPWEVEKERTLRLDLASERYFIIVKAYDMKAKVEPGHSRRPAWILYMNMSSPGNNFRTALADMSAVSSDYFGRSTDAVKTIKPATRTGTVTVAPFVIIGEK